MMGVKPKNTRKKSKKPVMLPNILFFALLRRPKSPADIIHRTYVVFFWRQCRTLKEKAKVLYAFLVSPITIIKKIKKMSHQIDKKLLVSNKSKCRQFMEQFYLSYFFSIDPENYYLQEFYLNDGLNRARHFVNKGAIKNGVYRVLTTYGRLKNGVETCSLGNKFEFNSFCSINGLPTVNVIKEFLADGSTSKSSGLPDEDIFCKPNIDNEGHGAEVWFWDKDNKKYKNQKGKTLTKEKLEEHLMRVAKNHICGSMLVQPLILPHPNLEGFRKNATPTIRIISYINSKGRVKLDLGMLRFSNDYLSVVDNASAGGIVVPIDMKKGTLGQAISSDISLSNSRLDSLNSGEVKIKGLQLPYWNDTLKLVIKAHGLFPSKMVIGWDIIIARDGPILLEGNSQPGICYIQRAHNKSIGQTKFGKAMANHCTKAINDLYSGRVGTNYAESPNLYNNSKIIKWLSILFFPNKQTVTLKICGKVHNVGYRKWVQKKAKNLKVDVVLRNLEDKCVEAVFSGRAVDIEDLIIMCQLGPEKAYVEAIKS